MGDSVLLNNGPIPIDPAAARDAPSGGGVAGDPAPAGNTETGASPGGGAGASLPTGPVAPNAVGANAGSGGATTDTVSVSGSGLVFNNTFESSVASNYMANIITAEQDL